MFLDLIGFEEIQSDVIIYTIINCLCKTGHASMNVVALLTISRGDNGYSPDVLGGGLTYTTIIKGLISQHTVSRVDNWGK